MKKKTTKYIVRSTDGKWFAENENWYSEDINEANKFTKEEADKIISAVTVMNLEMVEI